MKNLRKAAALAALVFGLAAGTTVNAAEYAPLNCAAARTPTERAICSSDALGRLEARMATLYQWTTTLVGMGQRGDIVDSQRAFIRRREACGAAVACISNAYGVRIGELEAVMRGIASRGPF